MYQPMAKYVGRCLALLKHDVADERLVLTCQDGAQWNPGQVQPLVWLSPSFVGGLVSIPAGFASFASLQTFYARQS
jgi:hypothetical protein